ARYPVTGRAGFILLSTGSTFGLGSLLFGLSTSFWLSMVLLAVMGACGMISVVIRQAIVQLVTPHEVRGRGNAAGSMVMRGSNDMGALEAGVTASWWGAVPAVIVGGATTVGIMLLLGWTFPALRHVDSLNAEKLIAQFRGPHDRSGAPSRA